MGACFCGPLNYIAFLCPLALLLTDKRRIRCLAGRMGGSKKLSGNYFNQITGGLGGPGKVLAEQQFPRCRLLTRKIAHTLRCRHSAFGFGLKNGQTNLFDSFECRLCFPDYIQTDTLTQSELISGPKTFASFKCFRFVRRLFAFHFEVRLFCLLAVRINLCY